MSKMTVTFFVDDRPIVSQLAQYQLLMAPLVIQFQQRRKMLSVKHVRGLVLACICIMMTKQPVCKHRHFVWFAVSKLI